MLAPSRDYDVAAPFWRANPAVAAALAVAIVGAATIAGAWFFELVLKLRPCPLCLEQRVPYYIGIPLALDRRVRRMARRAARARHRRADRARRR